MAITPEQEEAALATPLGKAFKRLFSDGEFVSAVIDDVDAATAEYGLDADDKAALQSDAYALEGEVSGFGFKMGGLSMDGLVDMTGGMKSPGRFGMPGGHRWTGCLTCT